MLAMEDGGHVGGMWWASVGANCLITFFSTFPHPLIATSRCPCLSPVVTTSARPLVAWTLLSIVTLAFLLLIEVVLPLSLAHSFALLLIGSIAALLVVPRMAWRYLVEIHRPST